MLVLIATTYTTLPAPALPTLGVEEIIEFTLNSVTDFNPLISKVQGPPPYTVPTLPVPPLSFVTGKIRFLNVTGRKGNAFLLEVDT